jgi:hypothetical protein
MSGNLIDIHRKLFKDGHTDLNFEDWLALFESDQDVQDDAYSKYTGESAGTNEQAAWNSNLFIKSGSSSDIKTPKKIEGPLNPEYIKKMDKDGDGYFDNTQSVVNGYLMPTKKETPKLSDEDWTLEGMLGNTTDPGKYLKPKTEQEEQVGKDNDYYNNFVKATGDTERSDIPEDLMYNADKGFVSIDRAKAEFQYETNGQISSGDPLYEGFFNKWAKENGYSFASEINSKRIGAQKNNLIKNISNIVSEKESTVSIADQINNDPTFKEFNLNATVVRGNTGLGDQDEVVINLSSLMNHFPNPNFSPMDKNGNIVIRQSDLDNPAKLKQFRQKMLQVHQLLADRQKKYGNTDAIINNALSYSSEVEGVISVGGTPGHYIGDDFEKTQFHADMISNNQPAVKERLEKINKELLKGTGLQIHMVYKNDPADKQEHHFAKGSVGDGSIKYKTPDTIALKLYDEKTGETVEFLSPAALQKYLSKKITSDIDNGNNDLERKLTDNALRTRDIVLGDEVKKYDVEVKKEKITYNNILDVYQFKDNIFKTKEGDKEYQQIASEADEYLRSTISAGKAPDLQGFKDSLNKGYISNNAPSPYGDPAPRGGWLYIFKKVQ